jgi:hypothetical protein
MSERIPADQLSVDDLEELLYRKKRAQRQERLQRLKQEGRVVDVAGLAPPAPLPPTLRRPPAAPGGAMRRLTLNGMAPAEHNDAEVAGTGDARYRLALGRQQVPFAYRNRRRRRANLGAAFAAANAAGAEP